MNNLTVLPIPHEQCKQWLLKKHYARRLPPISYSFGMYRNHELIGIVTYGIPVSSSLRLGICGNEWKDYVLELNRLCCENSHNIGSCLIGRSLRLLPKPSIVVSFADISQGHVGYIYQATNFIYTGLSAKRTDWKIKGMEHLHGATIADISRGKENRAAYMREKYGTDFYLQDRPQKHRYIYFIGTAKERKNMKLALLYPVCPYPKGETKRYDAGDKLPTQDILF